MFDIHCHMLPGIDDGAKDMATSLAMARLAVAGGVTVQACTPHIQPGVYNNTGPAIRASIASLQATLDDEGVPLRLVCGADVHLVPDMIAGLKNGHLLTLADSRYVLIEPPHHIAPIRLVEQFFNVMVAGYHPILTHPERLHWISTNYLMIQQLCDAGVWMQITASSITGAFGRNPLYWSERMIDEGRVHIIASDAHDTRRRPPNLLEGYYAAAKRVGEAEAANMVATRPQCILDNQPPSSVPAPSALKVAHENLARSPGSGSGTYGPASSRSGESVSRGLLRGLLDGVRRLSR